MSLAVPPFLAALGFTETPHDIDERTLRRAYARALKLIDVETEPARFQALREALEQALRWLAFRDQARPATPLAANPAPTTALAPENASAPAVATPPAPVQSGAAQMGSAVFASLHPQVATFHDDLAARAALDRALSDERLLNIDARTFFEWDVARLLAGGWHPGHEHLLEPAIAVFDWAADHARLAHFGQVGALLSAAIRDSVAFRQFPTPQIVALNRLIARIRAAAPPDPGQLQEEVQQLQFLVQRVPNWLRIVAPVAPVNQRFELWRQKPSAPSSKPEPMPAYGNRKTTSSLGPGALVMMALMVLVGVSNLGKLVPNHPDKAASHIEQSTEMDTDLALRQQRAEALLSNIRATRATPSVAKRSDDNPPAYAAPLPASTDLDKPWWAPAWAGTSGTAPTN